jgi:hypothetical protein
MDIHDRVHVALLPPDRVDDDLVQKSATIINKSPYITRLLLAGKIPRIIGHYSSMQPAEVVVKGLVDLGLKVIACKDTDIHRPAQSFKARAMQFGQNEITFRDKSNRSLHLDADQAFLIIKGMLEMHEDIEVTKTKRKLNLPATILTGGIPIRRKVTEKTIESNITTESFMRVYSKNALDADIHNFEIRQYNFDYSCLGKEIAPASLVNFISLVTRTRGTFPKAILDDRLTRYSGIDLPSATPWEKIDVICNLIYIFNQLDTVNRELPPAPFQKSNY